MEHADVFTPDSCKKSNNDTSVDVRGHQLVPVKASGSRTEENTIFLENVSRCIKGRMRRDILNLAPTESDIIDGKDGYVSVGYFIEHTIAKVCCSMIYEQWVADVIDRLYWECRQMTGSDLRAVMYVFKRDNGLLLKSDMKICQDAALAVQEARKVV